MARNFHGLQFCIHVYNRNRMYVRCVEHNELKLFMKENARFFKQAKRPIFGWFLDHLNFWPFQTDTFQKCFNSVSFRPLNLILIVVFSRDLLWNKNATSEVISSYCAEVVRSCIIYLQHTLALLQFTGCSASHGSMHPSGWVG